MKGKTFPTGPKEKKWGELIIWSLLFYFGLIFIVAFVYSMKASFYLLGAVLGLFGWLLLSVCWWSLFDGKYYERTYLIEYKDKIIYDNCVIFTIGNSAYKFSRIYKHFKGIPSIVYFNAFGRYKIVEPHSFYPIDRIKDWRDK